MDEQNGTPEKKAWPVWANAFLTAYATCGVFGYAAKCANVGRNTVYSFRKACKEFERAFRRAKRDADDVLEMEARKRATRKKKPSDLLMIFLLKGNKPKKYRERKELQHTGRNGEQLPVTFIQPIFNAHLNGKLEHVNGSSLDRGNLEQDGREGP